jgi:hypothetical protein
MKYSFDFFVFKVKFFVGVGVKGRRVWGVGDWFSWGKESL